MTIPKTFSAPSDETYPALKGFRPSQEDALRYAVWLMMMADDVNRRAYSYVPDDPTRGVRITQGRPDHDPETLSITLPCQIIGVALQSGRFTYSTSRAGELEIVIACAHLEATNTSMLRPDVDAPSLTAETRLDRQRQILMRGTLYKEGMESDQSRVIDPYRTPLKEDGTYDLSAVKWLSVKAPDITPTRKITFPNRRVKSDAELLALDPVKDFAVSFGWLAKYTVVVSDRDEMR